MNTSEPRNLVHGQILPGAPPLCRATSGVIRATTTVKDITCDICMSWVTYYNPEQAIVRTTAEHVDILTKHILGEQARLWSDLAEHIRMAANRVWSVGCDGAVYRLVLSMRLVGPIDMGKVQIPLLGGVYQAVCETAEIKYNHWEPDDWAAVEEYMLASYGGRERLIWKYEETVKAIRKPCDGIVEANYTRDHPNENDND